MRSSGVITEENVAFVAIYREIYFGINVSNWESLEISFDLRSRGSILWLRRDVKKSEMRHAGEIPELGSGPVSRVSAEPAWN